MLQAVARLREAGYQADLRAEAGATLRCGECDRCADARSVTIEETARFEGNSNPDDESILIAITMACGHRGLYSTAFGPATPPDDAALLRALAAA